MTIMMLVRSTAKLATLMAVVYVAGWSAGPLPPLGPLLDPANGIWAVSRSARLESEFTGVIPALDSAVEVVYDRRGVPHIWAGSIEDAIRGLGFVVARDRLFQLEVQSRAPQGTLTELVGPGALESDRQQRSIGLAWSAEREVASGAAAEDMDILSAYANGVNAWIDAMKSRDLPFEYRLLQQTPRRWTPLHSALVAKRMGYVLAYDAQELWRMRVDALIGHDAAMALFPINAPIVEPIRPNGSTAPRFDFLEPPPPQPAALGTGTLQLAGGLADILGISGIPTPGGEGEGVVIGSNNWAVAPARTKNKHALLAGDPHLSLSLPSIWYEVHLVVPGELDVHGVTIPGIPIVLIGFNRDLAWSFTNTNADVMDFYTESFDDPQRPTQYRLDGAWKPLTHRVERFTDPNGALLHADTVLYTHRGPIVSTGAGNLSMRWVMLEQHLTPSAFVDAARARDVHEWLTAMEGFTAPAQNGIVADRSGNIAIRATGLYPIRPGGGDGVQIRDGRTSSNDWQGYWESSRFPSAINPPQGYLASANQQPLDPRVDDGYLGANWPSPWRAMRINQLLRADTAVTVERMSSFQTDPGNAKTEVFLPAFIEAGRGRAEVAEAVGLLDDWDRRYTKENERAVLFEAAMGELSRRTWDELTPPGNIRAARTPAQAVLAGLLQYPQSVWWDDRRTEARETRDDILAASLRAAFDATVRRHGPVASGGWRWSAIRRTNIFHLLRLRGLSALGLPIQGGPGTLNPSTGGGTAGASWRMVVELGPQVRAWATYPGGQSGNPASRRYLDRLAGWTAGELEPVVSPRRPENLSREEIVARLILRRGS